MRLEIPPMQRYAEVGWKWSFAFAAAVEGGRRACCARWGGWRVCADRGVSTNGLPRVARVTRVVLSVEKKTGGLESVNCAREKSGG